MAGYAGLGQDGDICREHYRCRFGSSGAAAMALRTACGGIGAKDNAAPWPKHTAHSRFPPRARRGAPARTLGITRPSHSPTPHHGAPPNKTPHAVWLNVAAADPDSLIKAFEENNPRISWFDTRTPTALAAVVATAGCRRRKRVMKRSPVQSRFTIKHIH